MHYLEIPQETVVLLGGISNTRLWCGINDNPPFQCGLAPLGEGRAYISINVRRMESSRLAEGDLVRIVLRQDDSAYGMEMPEELREVLNQDPEADRRFHALTPGKQRNIIYYISQVKSEQKRVERSLMLMDNLRKLPEGKETVRALLLGPGA